MATRRPLLPRWTLLAAAVLVLFLMYLGSTASRQATPGLAFEPAAPPEERVAAAGDVPSRPLRSSADRSSRDPAPGADQAVFAVVDGLRLTLPYPEPSLIAFHEATRPEALALDPLGRLLGNDNPTKFSPGAESVGPGYRVLSSRGRARPATSAADIVVPTGALARAPVTGRVVEVRRYVLYGKIRDWRVVIEPHERPDLQVVLVHLHEPVVEVGDEVTAGATTLAAVRQLPFSSHVDYHLDEEAPHVHLEVKPALPPTAVDPNVPASDPDEAEE